MECPNAGAPRPAVDGRHRLRRTRPSISARMESDTMERKCIPALAAAGLLLGLALGTGRSEEPVWHAVNPNAPSPTTKAAASPVPAGPAVSIGRPEPIAKLGVPLLSGPSDAAAAAPFVAGAAAVPVNYNPANLAKEPQPTVIRCEAPGDVQPLSGPPPVPPPPPPPPGGPYGGEPYNSGVMLDHPLGHSWGDRCREFLGFNGGAGCERRPFQSDHQFDCLISPVSNPFFFEDPRSLTEVRPLFIYQSVPHSDPYFQGGNAEFFGVQGRLALNERWSVVISKLGWVSIQPNHTDATLQHATGFAEFDLGPKWTFYRNEQNGGLAAAGLNFNIPVGDKKVFQDTGDLALDPYIVYGKNFGRLPEGYGSFNFLGQAGYEFGLDNKRAEFFHASFHLDYDVANLHKFYPLAELNWFQFTKRGTVRDVGTEGADLINFGSSTIDNGRTLIRLAFGARYKFNENLQTGFVFEFPLTHQKALSDFRVGIDFIFRY